jgi:hypothetical protein
MKGRGARPAKDLYVAPRMQLSIVGQFIMNPKYLDPRYKACMAKIWGYSTSVRPGRVVSSEVLEKRGHVT